MAEKNIDEEELSRGEVADRIQEIAADLGEGEEFGIDIGNKTSTLRPPSAIDFEVSARENPRFSAGAASRTIKMDWRSE